MFLKKERILDNETMMEIDAIIKQAIISFEDSV